MLILVFFPLNKVKIYVQCKQNTPISGYILPQIYLHNCINQCNKSVIIEYKAITQ